MRTYVLTAVLVLCAVPAFAARLPGPYPSDDEPAEPPPPSRSVILSTDDDARAGAKKGDEKRARPVYEETAKNPSQDAPR